MSRQAGRGRGRANKQGGRKDKGGKVGKGVEQTWRAEQGRGREANEKEKQGKGKGQGDRACRGGRNRGGMGREGRQDRIADRERIRH